MDRIDLLKTFLKVADTGSFTAAAERLDMTPQLASKYIRALECELGAQLFHRSTRRVNMTETGVAFYDRCARLVEDFEELKADVRQEHCSPRGQLRLTAPHCFGGKYLVEALADFSAEHTEISATLDLTDRYVNLLDEGIDLAIRIGNLEDSSLLARQIGMVPVVLCASPEYIANAPDLNNPNDLENHACIIDTNFKSQNKWTFLVDGQPVTYQVEGRLKVNSASGARTLALKGQGLLLSLQYMVDDDIKSGRLIPLLPDYMATKLAINAVYPPTRHLSARVRRFIDFMADRFKHLK
ncbi:LysR family transcriptional regulator [Stappia sp. BW2]|uniref:LysR family transcriptional regulator n=1 Tax=Stappia sp. BW2 TaxID=2592622 RepID=UPI0011DEF8E7|nr:LysR family transcriptional regulator [Stappia sp. BW2]TYC80133.1 LysR family transcriptional regulator [Stappia sp. BW2]